MSIESILAKDAYLVFRALCKLSIRSSDNSAAGDLTVLRGKVHFAFLLLLPQAVQHPLFSCSPHQQSRPWWLNI